MLTFGGQLAETLRRTKFNILCSNLFLQQDESIHESDSASSTPGAGAGHGTWQPKYLEIILFS